MPKWECIWLDYCSVPVLRCFWLDRKQYYQYILEPPTENTLLKAIDVIMTHTPTAEEIAYQKLNGKV